MSLIVHYRPLPPDDGAEVPLDLHDSRSRHFRFKPRFPRAEAALEEIFYREFGLAWKEVTSPEVPRGVVFAHFGPDLGNKSPNFPIALAACFRDEQTRGMRRDECESLFAWRFGEPSRGMTRGERASLYARQLAQMTLFPLVLIATADSRWIERRLVGLRLTTWGQTIEDETWSTISHEEDGSYTYREVNPYFAAWLWEWETFVPPGPMPPDLKQFRDPMRVPRRVVRLWVRLREDDSFEVDRSPWDKAGDRSPWDDSPPHVCVDPYGPFDWLPRPITKPSLATQPEANGHAPEALAYPPELVAAATPDFADLAAELRKARKPTRGSLVEYMADKREATVEDVAEHVHANGETDEKTVRANANRTNDSLAELGAPLSFRVASGRVFREDHAK